MLESLIGASGLATNTRRIGPWKGLQQQIPEGHGLLNGGAAYGPGGARRRGEGRHVPARPSRLFCHPVAAVRIK